MPLLIVWCSYTQEILKQLLQLELASILNLAMSLHFDFMRVATFNLVLALTL
jgi:hypothetical protein